jgi:3alpha(or 20beta)-hydroxysteroid dehydrogenase
MGQLDGKISIITGGAAGIGLATAERFVREGAKVLLVDRDASVLERANELGENARGLVADVADEADAARYVAAAEAAFGGVDVLFANAGIEGVVGPITAQRAEDVLRVLGVNVLGVLFGIKHAAPAIAKRGGGAIVVTSSVAGLVGSPGLAPYVASKHAVIGLVKTAALELGSLGIRVNAVNPGPVDNRMMRSIEEQSRPGHATDVKKAFESLVALGRYATSEEIASAVLFLASDASTIITGTTLVADGGFVAR